MDHECRHLDCPRHDSRTLKTPGRDTLQRFSYVCSGRTTEFTERTEENSLCGLCVALCLHYMPVRTALAALQMSKDVFDFTG